MLRERCKPYTFPSRVTQDCHIMRKDVQNMAKEHNMKDYICVQLAALQKTHIRDRPVTISGGYTIYADEKRRVIEVWQQYLEPLQLASLVFKALFDSLLLDAFRADGIPGKSVRLINDIDRRTTAAECATSFKVVTGLKEGAVAGPFLFNFAIEENMGRTVNPREL
ncbi:hypothetical protein RB195_003185 [Necator americanus]|uniref:Reverse transcriptase domain-containing protein n=1 Tax=Necator americanus TaxID=51031 RepID=A0ABR1DMQ8_NECAM